MVKVGWTLQAIDDIENIANFISKDSYRYAQIQVQRFRDHTWDLPNYLSNPFKR